MGRIFTVVFNSALGNGATTNQEIFYFDWSTIEEGKYKVSFSFMSAQGGTAPTNSTVANIFMDLGQQSNMNIASSNLAGQTYPSTYLGSLQIIAWATQTAYLNYYYADLKTNPPIYLDSRPKNNVMSIQLATNASNPLLFTPVPGQYTLTLSLEKQD